MIDKDKVKDQITPEQVFEMLQVFGGEPYKQDDDSIISRTICHNHRDEDASHKLYYYPDNQIFMCYTNCGAFDIYDLILKAYEAQYSIEMSFPEAVRYAMDSAGISTFGVAKDDIGDSGLDEVSRFLERIDKIHTKKKDKVLLKEYKTPLIKNLPTIENLGWQYEGINKKVQDKYEIKYHPVAKRIVIPHYDINGRLVGIRGRAVDDDDAEQYGKYTPLYSSGEMYNHPLGFNLYGIHKTKDNIKKFKTAIVFESEKSVMLAEAYMGDSNISVATCGFNISDYQMDELLSLGVNEVVVAFDRDYKSFGDEEYYKWEERLLRIVNRYKNYVNISIMFDKEDRLGYKDAPIDCGQEIFFQLLQERQALK